MNWTSSICRTVTAVAIGRRLLIAGASTAPSTGASAGAVGRRQLPASGGRPAAAGAAASPTRATSASGTRCAISSSSRSRSRSTSGRRPIPASPSRRPRALRRRRQEVHDAANAGRAGHLPQRRRLDAGLRQPGHPARPDQPTSRPTSSRLPAGSARHRHVPGQDVRRPARHRRPRTHVQQDLLADAGLTARRRPGTSSSRRARRSPTWTPRSTASTRGGTATGRCPSSGPGAAAVQRQREGNPTNIGVNTPESVAGSTTSRTTSWAPSRRRPGTSRPTTTT